MGGVGIGKDVRIVGDRRVGKMRELIVGGKE